MRSSNAIRIGYQAQDASPTLTIVWIILQRSWLAQKNLAAQGGSLATSAAFN